MKYFFLGLIIFLLQVLQGGFINQLGLGPVGQILVVFVTVMVMWGEPNEVWFCVLFSGLLLDFLSGLVDGTHMIAMLGIYGLASWFVIKFISRELNRFTLLIAVLGSTIIYSITIVLVNLLLSRLHIDQRLDYTFILGKKLGIDIIANLLLAYPVLSLYGLMKKYQVKFLKT